MGKGMITVTHACVYLGLLRCNSTNRIAADDSINGNKEEKKSRKRPAMHTSVAKQRTTKIGGAGLGGPASSSSSGGGAGAGASCKAG